MEKKHLYRSEGFLIVLILLLGLRITSYFTLFPDSVAMTQAVKVGLRLLLTGFSFFWLKKLEYRHPEHKVVFHNVTPLVLYGGYLLLGLLSFIWSSLLRYSMLQWAMVTEALVFSIFFYQLVVFYNRLSGDHGRFALLFGRSTAIICLVFIIGIFVDSDTFYRQTHGGEVSRLGGFIINPNELGMLAVLGAVMGYEELLDNQKKILNWLIIVVCTLALLLTQSRSSLLAFLAVSGLFVLRTKNVKVIFAAVVAAVIAFPILLQTVILKTGDVEEVMSMTGRIPFWQDLISDGFTNEPLLGYGFMCISYHDYFDSIHSYSAKMTHNTFIQVLLNLGLVGAFICFLQMVATGANIIKSSDKKLKGLALMMFIPVFINSLTEFGIFGESNYGIQFYHFIFLFSIISCQVKPKHKKYALPQPEHTLKLTG